MWTIIMRKDIMTYDVVPNCWLLNKDECAYPDVGLTKTKKMARECVQPQNDWDTVPIELSRRDVDNYERGLTDIIRLSLGKSTVTSSENEERGRGKRKSRPNHRLDFESHCVEKCNSSEGDCEDEESSPIADGNRTKVLPTHPILTPLLKKPRKENKVKSPAAPTHCRITTKKHTCPFDFDGVNFDHALGHAFCSLSRDISKINSNLSHLRECQDEIQKSVDLLMAKNYSGAENADPNIAVAHFPQAIIEDFPIASLEKLSKIEKKLLDREFMTRCVSYAASSAEKTTESRTVTSIMAKLVSLEVAVNFTWKGVQRKDQNLEKRPFKDLNISKLMIAAVKRCWVDADIKKINITAASWLAQSKAKLDKMKPKAVTDWAGELLDEIVDPAAE